MSDATKPIVLVAEDSDDDAFFFKRALKKSGLDCSAHFVINGAQAVEFLRLAASASSPAFPKVFFLDLKMPVLNGFEVLEWLRGQKFASAIKVVVLSGSDHQEDKTRALKLGAADYVVKPIMVDDLRRLLVDIQTAGLQTGAQV